MDFGFGPDERLGVSLASIDEGVDVLSELFDRGEGFITKGLLLQDREPDPHLIGGYLQLRGRSRLRPVPAHLRGRSGRTATSLDTLPTGRYVP
jgi:hypothetical protein